MHRNILQTFYQNDKIRAKPIFRVLFQNPFSKKHEQETTVLTKSGAFYGATKKVKICKKPPKETGMFVIYKEEPRKRIKLNS